MFFVEMVTWPLQIILCLQLHVCVQSFYCYVSVADLFDAYSAVTVPVVTDIKDLLCKPMRDKRPAHICLIVRGPPGSGKTYASKMIRVWQLLSSMYHNCGEKCWLPAVFRNLSKHIKSLIVEPDLIAVEMLAFLPKSSRNQNRSDLTIAIP